MTKPRPIPDKGAYLNTFDIQHLVGEPGSHHHMWRITYADDTNTIQREVFTSLHELHFFLNRLMLRYQAYREYRQGIQKEPLVTSSIVMEQIS